MKTIFITVSRGLIARNILRAKVVDKILEKGNFKVILLIPNVRGIEPPNYLFKEFESDRVKIEIVKNKSLSVWEKIFNRLFFKIVFSKSTKLYLQFHINEQKRLNKFSYFLHWLFFAPLSRLNFLKKICRKIDLIFLTTNEYAEYFNKYNPDLVFSTSIINHFDAEILKEAQRRGIKTISMPRSWDNLDKFLFRAEPDLLLVQNEAMKIEAKKYQAINPKKIKIVGFPQFDMYNDKSVILSKEKYCRTKNFNPDLPVIFIGSEGHWSKGDEGIFKKIIEARNNKLIPNCNILIRPHFGTVRQHKYAMFSGEKNVFIDDKFRKSDFFGDNWDPSIEDMIDFTNSLFHCNMMITFASTLALDTACFDKPIIAIKYGVKIINGEDKTHTMYDTGHYGWVLKTNAVSLVNNKKELIEKIKYYFKNPEYKHEERQELVKRLCFKVDGKSSQRIADAIISMINYN
ncbi:CDP-glycerol glycerophosphotransferase family protein [Candidatus Parcubacteria bacterium]|nr:CDP-glycerol glycerophosphotransferase family protein [Candidatus Parcubacteria bacterium]